MRFGYMQGMLRRLIILAALLMPHSPRRIRRAVHLRSHTIKTPATAAQLPKRCAAISRIDQNQLKLKRTSHYRNVRQLNIKLHYALAVAVAVSVFMTCTSP